MPDRICPLLLIAQPVNLKGAAVCKREGCAWWYADRCAVLDLAMSAGELTSIYDGLTDIAKAVCEVARKV